MQLHRNALLGALVIAVALIGCDDGENPGVDGGPMPMTDGGPMTMEDGGPMTMADGGPMVMEDGGPIMMEDGGPVVMEDAGPVDPATFTEVYAIIMSRCAPCHTAGASGNLTMSTQPGAYANLVNVDAAAPGPTGCGNADRVRVIPDNAEGSLLYQKVAGTHDCGGRMPQGGMLTEAQIEVFRSWIAAGAMDD